MLHENRETYYGYLHFNVILFQTMRVLGTRRIGFGCNYRHISEKRYLGCGGRVRNLCVIVGGTSEDAHLRVRVFLAA